MPHIIVYCPRLTREKKAACVSALTEAFERSTGLGGDILTIHIEEHSYNNIAVGGRLLTETYPELAEKERLFERDNP
ncbi:MAG: tautomerase family protein [Bauldia sp.]|nr:tautomerase family protein [Bauldia sp.]